MHSIFTIMKWLISLLVIVTKMAAGSDPCSSYGLSIDASRPGVITSPDYDLGKYPSDQKCHWAIKSKPNHFILFKFTDMEIENSDACAEDYVSIYRNMNEGIKIFCGPQIPQPVIYYMDEWLYITFSSNSVIEKRGFRLEYSLVDSNETCSKNEFKCHNGKCILPTSICDGHDNCGDGTDEENCNYQTKWPTSCGNEVIQPLEDNGDRIVGGTEVMPGSWPWQVTIQEKKYFPSGHFCGGVLINNFWVLTAAHCIEEKKMENLRIKFGKHNQFKYEKEEITRFVTKLLLYPLYDTINFEDDIGLVKLNAPVEYTDYIRPICLPVQGTDIPSGNTAVVTGWGRINAKKSAEVLLQISLPIVSLDECRELNPYFDLISTNICTSNSREDQNPCQGDSGGPLMVKDGSNWTVNGLVSYGSKDCTLQKPSVYTKVSSFSEWIYARIRNSESSESVL